MIGAEQKQAARLDSEINRDYVEGGPQGGVLRTRPFFGLSGGFKTGKDGESLSTETK